MRVGGVGKFARGSDVNGVDARIDGEQIVISVGVVEFADVEIVTVLSGVEESDGAGECRALERDDHIVAVICPRHLLARRHVDRIVLAEIGNDVVAVGARQFEDLAVGIGACHRIVAGIGLDRGARGVIDDRIATGGAADE